MKNTTELLLPVGNAEMFHAAVEGGADAVYCGLRQFNARGRASNFTIQQLQALVKLAKKKNVKVYLTLNTVIKNQELPELLDTLYTINQTGVDAIIIQDWGVLHLVKKHFPNIEVHASTQMANHNSLGANYSQNMGFERVVMARELTLPEVKEIRKKSNIELEIFMHGALCYSFSGMCLFSSFLGGSGANRGLCAQPCRRFYQTGGQTRYVFSLKDNQAIDVLPEMMKMGISSIKVEGRMKSSEYVNRVAKAYRMVIDNPQKIEDAKLVLKYDMSREKTAYFLGGNVSKAITENPETGIAIGEVIKVMADGFKFQSNHPLEIGNRLRIRSKNGEMRKAIKVKEFQELDKGTYQIQNTKVVPERGDQVFLVGLKQEKYPNKFREEGKNLRTIMNRGEKNKILNQIGSKKVPNKEQLFVRIDSLGWLRKIRLEDVDGLILNLPRAEWEELRLDAPFLQKNAHKITIELPKFIQEKDIRFYRDLCAKLSRKGYKNFMLSHLSQKLLLPPKSRIATNENVYLFNDAAIEVLRKEKINLYTYPLENDFENLLAGKDRFGIVPIYFNPHLFFSRMPVKVGSKDDNTLIDDENGKHRRILRDGITIIVPEHPVALFQAREKLVEAGFKRFLIDLSHEKPSSNTIKRLLNKFKRSEQLQPAFSFNFKKGLK
ncbi:MAG: peptidase U32 family protein [Marinifilaceae bacterium]|jgi:putative protease